MTNRERFGRTLQHRESDIVPYDIEFTIPAHQKMAKYYQDDDFKEKLGNCFFFVNFDGWDIVRKVGQDIFEDWWGTRWDRRVDKDIGNVANKLVFEDRLEDYTFPDPNAPELYTGKAEVIRRGIENDKIVVGNFGFSLFERAWALMGMEELMIAMVLNKPLVHRYLNKIIEYNLQVLEKVCSMNVDGFRFGDDWGDQRGVLMGPELWREFVKPRIRQMYDLVKSKGKFVMIHTCGKVLEIIPDFIEVGVDIFNPFQPEVMNVYEIKKEYGRDLSFYGGISIQQTLPYGSVQDVKNEVRRLLEEIGKDGGYIASPSHHIPGDAKTENMAAMIEVLQSQ